MSVDLRLLYRRIHFVAAGALQLSAAISTKLNPAERESPVSIESKEVK